MITKIVIENVASYKQSTELSTDKKLNLIYGLNGTGKSTLSNYLYDLDDPDYSECGVEGIDDSTKIIVYNQKFIRENFYESDKLNGIFTLSKSNKEAEEKIKKANGELIRLDKEKIDVESEIESTQQTEVKIESDAKEAIWEIKTDYTGGDRILKDFFIGLQRKDPLFSYLLSVEKPKVKPGKTVEELKREVEAIAGDDAQSFEELPLILFSGQEIENDSILQKEIVGNKNSSVASLIESLGNSDWVELGLNYIEVENKKTQKCPFCQKETVDGVLIQSIRDFFDESYKEDVARLSSLKEKYERLISGLNQWGLYESHPFVEDEKDSLLLKYNAAVDILKANTELLNNKMQTPGIPIKCLQTDSLFEDFNNQIKNINASIKAHNQKISDKEETLDQIKNDFWDLMRWEYDSVFITYNKELKSNTIARKALEDKKLKIIDNIAEQRKLIKVEQTKTVNIEVAVENIKLGLLDLGIDSFSIKKTEGNFYQIIRGSGSDKTFHTLSEGEKMIISFLYFIELCKGSKNAADSTTKRIVVIDDPISSLSHIYVFNIGQLIKHSFTSPKTGFCDQVFILTHSLYFFYEMSFTKENDRHEYQNLYRLVKNEDGSRILPMKYQEIQNDYQCYWQVVKDSEQSPALIANCMRNIIEYFYNFTEKIELVNVFQKEKLKDDKYQAFYRYMNRESHSLGQNLFDMKEFDYEIFKEAFRLVFEESGYQNHYKRMMK